MTSSSSLLTRLRRADPDRFFCTLFAPPEKRETLALLYLFNHELARAREVASEPILALIRLNWWREVVSGAPKKHELATPLAAALDAGTLPRDALLALIDARTAETEDIPDFESFMTYARATAGRLARTAGALLGADSDAVEDLGTAYGIAGLLRTANPARLPADGTPTTTLITTARNLLNTQPPRAALPAALPAVFARRDLGRASATRTTTDKLAVLRAVITGKV
jgi:phytoene synthase